VTLRYRINLATQADRNGPAVIGKMLAEKAGKQK
jgi:hypothetical protein